jgi:hypothetical protein
MSKVAFIVSDDITLNAAVIEGILMARILQSIVEFSNSDILNSSKEE